MQLCLCLCLCENEVHSEYDCICIHSFIYLFMNGMDRTVECMNELNNKKITTTAITNNDASKRNERNVDFFSSLSLFMNLESYLSSMFCLPRICPLSIQIKKIEYDAMVLANSHNDSGNVRDINNKCDGKVFVLIEKYIERQIYKTNWRIR